MRAVPVFTASTSTRRWPSWHGWLLFVGSLLLVEIFDAANDVVRGDLFPPVLHDAMANARQVVHFESVHGFFVEPDLYDFSRHPHSLLGITLRPATITEVANNVYAFCHFGVPILVAVWIFVWHRPRFGLFVTVVILTCLVTLAGYFLYPVAPPRLTSGIIVHGHLFRFHDTMPYPKSGIKINGRPLGYNPYAAMPSLHIAWASVVTFMVFLLTKNPAARAAALCYPAIMTLAIVITANHYIMDAVGGVLTFCVAAPIALAIESSQRRVNAAPLR